jgi:hypothetical protein
MTEAEWLACPNPRRLLDHLGRTRARPAVRRLRLFACACERQVWALLPDARRRLVEAIERRADGEADPTGPADGPPPGPDVATADDAHGARLVETFGVEVLRDARPLAAGPEDDVADALRAAVQAAERAALTAARHSRLGRRALPAARRGQAALVRDLFGNPFRPVTFDPGWRTADVVGLARAIYEDGAFDRLPLLADTLMDAGCADDQVLKHCRGGGPHARGCWVVDLVLGRE